MPRQPSVSHPLRTARQILGLSQPAFGAQVGVAGVTIQQIENRLMKMSRGLAQKISIAYGLDPDQLITGSEPGQPRFTEGAPFSREEYERRKIAPRDVDDRQTVDSHVANFTFALEALLDAANETRRYGPFNNALKKRLSELVEEFELRDTLEKIFTDYGVHPLWRYDFDTVLFRGPQREKLLENRDRRRPWRYGERPLSLFTKEQDKPPCEPLGKLIPITMRVADQYQFADRSEEPTARAQQTKPQSSRKGKSPRKPAPHPPPPGRGSAAQKPSKNRRGRAQG
jgi:transcriptional regulator with XRE-family HTH domain